MVDISPKDVTRRSARAEGAVLFSGNTVELIRKRLIPKGDPFETARIAGIMAAKRTHELIPLCHPLPVAFLDIQIRIEGHRAVIESEIRLDGKTGAEMEALTAVSVAALTIYDMCKAVDKGMVIEGIRLIEKKGGKSDKNAF